MRLLIEEFLDKKPDFGQLSKIDQVLYMAYFYVKISKDPIFAARNIEDYFDLAQMHTPTNIPYRLAGLNNKKKIIRKQNGYIFQREIFKKLEDEFGSSKPKKQVSHNLKALLSKIDDTQKKSFLEEAINCYEIGAYRAAIMMCWLLVLDHIYDYVIANKLTEFNSASSRKNSKHPAVQTKKDFAEFKESAFIEICRSASIISNDERKILDEKLGTRNTCAHPNPIKISESKATSYIEDIIENIMFKFN